MKQARGGKKAAKLIGKSNLAQQKLFRAFEFIMIGKVDQDYQRIEDEKIF